MAELTDLSDIERIGAFIAAGDFEVYVAPQGPAGEVEEIVAVLGTDAAGRSFVLKIFFLSDVAEAAGAKEDEALDTEILQFFMDFPVDIAPEQMADALRMAMLVTSLMPLGNLGVSDAGGYYLSYRLVLADRRPAPEVIQDVVGMLGFGVTAYGTALDEAARGETTAEAFAAGLADQGFPLGGS